MGVEIVTIVALAVSSLALGVALGVSAGQRAQIKMLTNMVDHGTAKEHQAHRTIVPETAEMRIDKSAAQVEQEYTAATIANGVAELKALCLSQGVQCPSDKELEAEVRDMLMRSGTPEAGVHV